MFHAPIYQKSHLQITNLLRINDLKIYRKELHIREHPLFMPSETHEDKGFQTSLHNSEETACYLDKIYFTYLSSQKLRNERNVSDAV